MEDLNKNFKDFEALYDFIQEKKVGNILIGYRNMPDYPGMVLGMGIIFDVNKLKYELDLEWISFGLDLFGENLLENYLFKFKDLQALLGYLQSKYNILVADIPMNYKIDQSLFPNPIKDSDQKPIFEAAWQKFQRDFREGFFLDAALQVVFSSNEI
ncbi:MAG: hypothetical protein K9J46_09180 [Saprospiraceae bacterium]|nr:hypothetical protein [Saprospiraceae bacterium]MCF8282124.1 hypothetical protein [Bacteroidales bacterium]